MDRLTLAATSSNAPISTSPDVAFVTMPFGPLFSPSIGLGLLKAGLTQAGIASHVYYFTLKFADWVGTTDYADISDGKPYTCGLLGEWLFSHALFGEAALNVEGYVNDVLRGQSPAYWYTAPADEVFIERILQIRGMIEPFLDYCVEQVLATHPPIVGFTSIFQQQAASLALAKRIKQQAPNTFIVFGGANCENVMGIEVVRQFGFVDAVVSGEADLIFPDLAKRVLIGETLVGLPGVYTQGPASQISDILYYTIRFARQIGARGYIEIADGKPDSYDLPAHLLVGEWIFASALFGHDAINDEDYIREVLLTSEANRGHARPIPPAAIERWRAIQGQTEKFLQDCVADVLRYGAKIVGFTSIFQQHTASLALAKRLKAIEPGLVIVFGGANCEGVMGAETLRQFPFVDAVVSGEGDLIFPRLVQQVRCAPTTGH